MQTANPHLEEPARGPKAGDVQPVEHETRDRVITALVTLVPFLALGLVAWQAWDRALHWHDLTVFAIVYLVTGLGVTVGFHRYLTHRSFATTKQVRAVLAALGSAAIEGPVISWVADHRKHHAFSDQEGDPHSPHVGHGGGVLGHLRGLVHAHLGWLFVHTHRAARKRYAPDLVGDPIISFIDRTFVLWAAVGLAVPFGLGVAIGGTITTGLTGLLWGGLVRIFVIHHVTYSINSLCHYFGRRRFDTGDESRNLLWLALPSFGESWHNNHHAFPTSARHGLRRWEQMMDPSGLVIRLLEVTGLAWDVVGVSPARQRRKELSATTGA
jgi:stearoyl-CoA desaturase (delta-9 desaturase)